MLKFDVKRVEFLKLKFSRAVTKDLEIVDLNPNPEEISVQAGYNWLRLGNYQQTTNKIISSLQ